MQDSYKTYKKKRGEKVGEKVLFENSILPMKLDKEIKVNFAQNSNSLKELCFQ